MEDGLWCYYTVAVKQGTEVCTWKYQLSAFRQCVSMHCWNSLLSVSSLSSRNEKVGNCRLHIISLTEIFLSLGFSGDFFNILAHMKAFCLCREEPIIESADTV